ncbi:MAG: hypothetical protein AAGF99_05145 [Bacteroidota bacterium]
MADAKSKTAPKTSDSKTSTPKTSNSNAVTMTALVTFAKGANKTLKGTEFTCTEAEAAAHEAALRARRKES